MLRAGPLRKPSNPGYNTAFDDSPNTMKITLPSAPLSLLLAGALAALTACGGGGGSASIGGTITGLNSGLTLVLQNNATDTFSITGTGNNSTTYNYRFATALSAGNAYSVTVSTQPLGETCSVANPTGNVDSSGDSVGSVNVSCAVTSTVVGTETGLNAGAALILSSNGSSIAVTSLSPTFSFPGVLATGSTYTVTIATQPAGQTCTLTNATGTVVANTPAVVTVSCV
jgi:hypothetical protein